MPYICFSVILNNNPCIAVVKHKYIYLYITNKSEQNRNLKHQCETVDFKSVYICNISSMCSNFTLVFFSLILQISCWFIL